MDIRMHGPTGNDQDVARGDFAILPFNGKRPLPFEDHDELIVFGVMMGWDGSARLNEVDRVIGILEQRQEFRFFFRANRILLNGFAHVARK